MLLAIDVGNTQTAIGIFDAKGHLAHHWRISTQTEETADEKRVRLANLLSLYDHRFPDLTGMVISSVVPACTAAYVAMAEALMLDLVVLDSSIEKGLKIQYERPYEVGADRIANSIAAFELFGAPTIVVDFGTATTFDVISAKGEYLGGIIVPGIEVSAEALFLKAAKLSRVELKAPPKVLGKNTAQSIQSGIIYGTASLVEGLVERLKNELNLDFQVVATGGLAELIAPHCKSISKVEPFLTLYGLQKIYAKGPKKKR